MAFESLTDRLAGVFKKLRGHGKLTEADIKAAMREVRMALLEADVNYKVAKDFCAKVSERAMGQEVMESLTPAQQVVKIVNEELVALMGGEEAPKLMIKNKGQTILMLCGLQGNGKTTHAAKLAKYFIKQGRRPMLVACDIYRPAAIDQLQVVGKQAGAPVFTLPGAKPPEIAKKALAHAKDYGNDILILDTAGRLQIDEVLMQELVQIKEAVPVDETLLVVDAMAGQDAVNVAKTFNETVGVDGIILTKTDGDTRGGAALSVLAVTGKPIKFQGVGEKLDDLEVFHPSRMASRILGMGDVLSLIERAQDAADEKAAEETAKRMLENKFDMNDMLCSILFLSLIFDVLTDHFYWCPSYRQKTETLTPERFFPKFFPDFRILFFQQPAAGTFISIDKFAEFCFRLCTKHYMNMVNIMIPFLQNNSIPWGNISSHFLCSF